MQKKSSWSSYWYPLTLGYLSEIFRLEKQEVYSFDCDAENISHEKILNCCREIVPDLIILNAIFPTLHDDIKFTAEVKKILLLTKIALIGMLPTLLKEKTFEYFPNADICVIGEPEWILWKLVCAIKGEKTISNKLDGIINRNENAIYNNNSQIFSDNNLDNLPFPDRKGFDKTLYRYPLDRSFYTLINISRGCYHDCSFCIASKYYGRAVRKRSVDKILQEIEECIRKYDIKRYLFWCDSFTIDRDYALNIINGIIKNKMNIKWSTRGRVDELDEEILKKMNQAGCRSFSIGIESTDPKVLELANKKTSLEIINRAIQYLHKSGIISVGHVIFGLPGETIESAFKTIQYLLRSNLDFAQFYCVTPYPGTKLWETVKEEGWLENTDISMFELSNACMGNGIMNAKMISKIRNNAYRKFYFRPKMIKTIVNNVRIPWAFSRAMDFKNWMLLKQ